MDSNIELNGIEVRNNTQQELDMFYYLTGTLIGKAHFFRRELEKLSLPNDFKKTLELAGHKGAVLSNITILPEFQGQGFAQDLWLQAELKRLEVWKDMTLCKTVDAAVQLDPMGNTMFTGWTTRKFPYIINGIQEAGFQPEILYENKEMLPWFVWKT